MTSDRGETVRALRRLSVAAFIVLGMWLGEAPAAAQVPVASGHECDNVPDCVVQKMAAFRLRPWATKNPDFYCTGEYPYFWNFSYWQTGGDSVSNIATSSSNYPDWVRILFTNWDILSGVDVYVALGCSKDNKWAKGCGPGQSDPGCPQVPGSAKAYCSNVRGIPLCIQTYQERCASGQLYTCTIGPVPVSWCQPCRG